jgi:hypothetical protein
VTALELAEARLRRQRALARHAATDIARLWARIDRTAIARSWAASLEAAAQVMESAQAIGAAGAAGYLDDLTATYNLPDSARGAVRAAGFAGTASDGRDLRTLLYQPAITALQSIEQGASVPRAMSAGRFSLDVIVRTQVADACRVADGVALTARSQLSGYVRMLSMPSCSRCVLLAGKRYRWNTGFQRHPRCDCRHIPCPEDVAGDLRTDPKLYFQSLPVKEQDRLFTPSGAQAIRDGGDISRVVNARGGMYTASGRRFTHTAAQRRPRLMPEQIYTEANGDRQEAIRLLKLHGFLI